jgi:hypothetical protein
METAEHDSQRINDASEKLYWGLLGHNIGNPDSDPSRWRCVGQGELRDLTPIQICNYVAASLSCALNRPVPIDEIGFVIVDVYESALVSHEEACSHLGKDAADDKYLPIMLKLEQAWLIVEAETGVFVRLH